MKYVLALIASLFFIAPVFANDIVIKTQGSLSAEQEAELASQAAKMVADNTSGAVTPTKAKEFQEWVDIGNAIGSGLASTARELGIAANDFVKTPVGKLTAVLIVWHFIGSTLIHVGFGVTWTTVLLTVLYVLYRRMSYKITTTNYDGKGPNGEKRTVVRTPVNLTDGQNGFFIVSAIIVGIVGVLAFVTI